MKSIFPTEKAEVKPKETTSRFTIDVWYINRQSEQLVTPPLTRSEYETMIDELHYLKKNGVVEVPIDLAVMSNDSDQSLAVYPSNDSESQTGIKTVRVWSTHFLLADTINRIQVIPTMRS